MNIKHAVLYVGIVQAILEQRTDFKLILERVTILGVQPGDSSDIADGLSGHVHHRLRLTSDSSDFVQHCITLYCNYENHICPFNIIVRYIQLFQFFSILLLGLSSGCCTFTIQVTLLFKALLSPNTQHQVCVSLALNTALAN